MIAALCCTALLLATSVARAEDSHDWTEDIFAVAAAKYLGSHGRCPRFRVVERNIIRVLTDAGFDSADVAVSGKFDALSGLALSLVVPQYERDPSASCSRAWLRFGPDGTYTPQLLQNAD